MGRYRRKDKRKKNLGEKRRTFNVIEQDLLEAYLQYYHHAANRACFPPDINDGYDSDDDETIRMSNRQATAFETDSTWIGGHEFPALALELLEQPFLALPFTLGARERRAVYELCLHVGLYHTGAGLKFKDRHTVLSIHPDGFDHVPNLDKPLDFPVARCKPWFHRNDIGVCPSPRKGMSVSSYTFSPHFLSRHKVRDTTRKTKVLIEDLMAYPYQCLREDFESIESLSSILKFEDRSGKNGTILVDSVEKMRDCAKVLSSDGITELAFDVEAYNASKYKQSTCLIQLRSNLEHEYVIDVLAPGVWDEVSLLQPIFSNPEVVKIGHGISGIDVPCLHRDFGIFIVNAFDTFEAASKLRLKGHLSLAKLCAYYKLPENVERHAGLKEIYQNCDWRERPLKDDQVEYSILDVRYLIQLRVLLIKDILDFDSVPPVVAQTNGASIVSPLKLNRENSVADNSAIGGVDSMDIEVDTIEENENTLGNEDEGDDYECQENEGQDDIEPIGTTKRVEFDENSFFTAHDDNDGKSQSTIGSKVSELRYNQVLMDVLKTSQQKCLALWTEMPEPLDKNEMLLHLMKRADRIATRGDTRMKKIWTKEDYWLYKELFEWRADAAKKIGIVPSFLCTLNLLVAVAYKRPGSLISLRRLNYFLPENFTEADPHLEDLFSVVAGAGAENELVNTDAIVRLYSERKIRRKLPMVSQSNTTDAGIDEGDGEANEISFLPVRSADDSNSESLSKDKTVSRQPRFYTKLTMTAAVASIAIFWMKVLKKRK